ncbi:MAG TPA: hypothetical protein VI138_03240 [Candidatus Dormibacteraeota bacterium]
MDQDRDQSQDVADEDTDQDTDDASGHHSAGPHIQTESRDSIEPSDGPFSHSAR